MFTTALAVATGWRWLEETTPQLSGNVGREKEIAEYYPGGRSCDPSAIGPFPYQEPLSDTETCKEASEEHRLKANDLIQQTRSADAADAMVGLSYKQTLLAIIGMGFGFLTFCAAVAAAIYAKRAAAAAEGAESAAWEAVAATREVGESQTRAYLSVDKMAVHMGTHGALTVSPCIRNTGQSPANHVHYVVEVKTVIYIGEDGQPFTSACDYIGPIAVGYVAGGASITVKENPSNLLIHEDTTGREPVIDGVNKDGQLVSITIAVFAVDVFGKEIESFESGEFLIKRKLPTRFHFQEHWQASGIYFDIDAMRSRSWPDKAERPKTYGYRQQ